jgi:predicted RNA-binding protein with PUA-like domain
LGNANNNDSLRSGAARKYWLMKSEPDECSIGDLLAAPGRSTAWSGVRNFQARNFMRDQMRPGDGVLFFHSSCGQPGIAGLAEVASEPYPDATQFDRKSPYFDPRATRAAPRWFNVDVRGLRKTRLVPLAELRRHRALAKMWVLRPGNRLSVTPVSEAQWKYISSKLLAA